MNDNLKNDSIKIHRVGLPNQFVDKYGSQEELHNVYNLNSENLIKIARKLLYKK